MNAQALVISDNAAKKVRQLRDSEGNQDLMLRVYVTVLILLKVPMKMMPSLKMVMSPCWSIL